MPVHYDPRAYYWIVGAVMAVAAVLLTLFALGKFDALVDRFVEWARKHA